MSLVAEPMTTPNEVAPAAPVATPRAAIPQRDSPGRRAFQALMRVAIRIGMRVYFVALAIARVIHLPGRRMDGPVDVLVTGTFHSDNWVRAHLLPLAASAQCRNVRVVSVSPIPAIDKVTAVYPPNWLRRTIGDVPARLAVFCWAALRHRPHWVGGFHMLLNGLVAALMGRLAGGRSIYFCVGGPMELIGGGALSENRLFAKMGRADDDVERQLVKAVGKFDLVVTMGTRAVDYFKQWGIAANYHVVSGGIDSAFDPAAAAPGRDLVLVGRLVEVKRIDLFLRAIAEASRALPRLTATIVGDGPLRPEMERLASELGIVDRVEFAGQQNDVPKWLRQARLFVLTSDSEGLALSLMEAMTCGLPAVVSNVGDLGDLVQDGVNGFLVDERTPQAFAARMVELLSDANRLSAFSQAARTSAMKHQTPRVIEQWDGILESDGAGADCPSNR